MERPETVDEFYRKHKKAIEKRKAALKFESEGQRKDYEKAVKSNPENIYGLPPFFPALKIKMFYPNNNENINKYYSTEEIIKRSITENVAEVEFYCDICGKITKFSISTTQSFCKKCGTKYNMKLYNKTIM